MAVAIGPYGRTCLHIAVLVEEHAIVQFIAKEFPESLKRGDHVRIYLFTYINNGFRRTG